MVNDIQQQTTPHVDVGVQLPMPPLEPGDHLDQKTFHERYEAMPDNVKAELIGGVVYMPAALRRKHGRYCSLLIHWLYTYEDATPGVEVYDNATTIMGEESEPQPDVAMLIRPDCGGQMAFTHDDYLQGAPELAVEVASSTESYDLHAKKADYELAGAREYLVVALRQKKVFWFVNRDGKFEEQTSDANDRLTSSVFPGLWLDPAALIELNSQAVIATLREGLDTADHAAFVELLRK